MFIDLAGVLYDWKRIVCVEFKDDTVIVKMRTGTVTRGCSRIAFDKLVERAARLRAFVGHYHIFSIAVVEMIESECTSEGHFIKYIIDDGTNITMGPMTKTEHDQEMTGVRERLQN